MQSLIRIYSKNSRVSSSNSSSQVPPFNQDLLEFDISAANDQRELSKIESSLKSTADKRSKLTIALQKKSIEYREAKARQKEHNQKLSEAKGEVIRARGEVSKATEEIEYLARNAFAKESALKRLQEETKAKERLKEELKLQCERLQKQLVQDAPQLNDNTLSSIFPIKEDLLRVSANISTLALHIDSSKRLERENVTTEESLTSRRLELEEKRKDFQEKLRELEKNLKALRNKRVTIQNSISHKKANFEASKAAKEEQRRVLFNLQTALADHLEDRELADLHADFSKTVSGFHGELASLIRPTLPKYEIPLKLALGGAAQYLIVENEEAAKGVASLLKDKGIQKDVLVMENIPDSSLEKDASALRSSLKGNGILAFDCVDFERGIPGLEKCLMFLLKGKAFSEDFNRGKLLRGTEGCSQIVTIDGNIIRKGQLVSHGNLESLAKRTRFSREIGGKQKLEKEMIKARASLQEIETKLKANSGATEEEELSSVSKAIMESENEKVQIEASISALQARESEFQGKADLARAKAERHRTEQAVLNKKSEEAKSTLASLEIKAQTFLGKSFHWTRIEEYSQVKAQLARAEDEISHLRIEALENAISETQLSLSQLAETRVKANESLAEANANLEKTLSNFNSVAAVSAGLAKEVAKASEGEEKEKVAFERLLDETQTLEKEALVARMKISEKIAKKAALFEEAKMKGEPVLSQSKANSFESTLLATEENLHVDYSALENVASIIEGAGIDEFRRKLQEEIREKAQKLDELSSSLSSSLLDKRLSSINEKLSEKTTELESFQKEEVKLSAEFSEIKGKRVSTFMKLFEPVSFCIDSVYKALTKDENVMDMGGSALLFLENTSEPFSGGILYSPTPSTKRFVYDVDQLSGGEKTIAGLALLFAVSKVCGQRVLVFDEVDAFLDNENTKKYLKYISANLEKEGIQSLVVTHKPTIYENMESLVGVAINAKKGSQAFSLDLRTEIQAN